MVVLLDALVHPEAAEAAGPFLEKMQPQDCKEEDRARSLPSAFVEVAGEELGQDHPPRLLRLRHLGATLLPHLPRSQQLQEDLLHGASLHVRNQGCVDANALLVDTNAWLSQLLPESSTLDLMPHQRLRSRLLLLTASHESRGKLPENRVQRDVDRADIATQTNSNKHRRQASQHRNSHGAVGSSRSKMHEARPLRSDDAVQRGHRGSHAHRPLLWSLPHEQGGRLQDMRGHNLPLYLRDCIKRITLT
mmetsp:Transcript_40434/g.64715  ORF Transcript_40434/g.64715 Transcript_40434/m.64715 type:complete len:248 (-) Transcript_40434:257-1000(-)